LTRAVDHTQAVILSGGGAYAAYEVGVMKALFTGESPSTGHALLNPGVFTGTSAGAINAAAMASCGDDICQAINYLERVWVELISGSLQRCGNGVFRFRADPLRYLDPRCVAPNPVSPLAELAEDAAFFAQDWFRRGVNFLMAAGRPEERLLDLFDFSSLISTAPLSGLLREIISLEEIRRSDRLLRVVATNWRTGEVRTFVNQEMTEEDGYQIIMGSAAIPGVFPPVRIGGDPYVDGGVLMNTPLNCAIEAGATTLHVVYMDPDVANLPLQTLQSTIDVLDRLLTITSASKTNEDIDSARWINEGLDAIERASRGAALDDSDARAFIRVAAQVERRIREGAPYRKLTIHRYHPKDDLGGGSFGLLNFSRARMVALIARGFSDALNHDCAANHCILPG
jgi:NTE family protein